MKQNSMIYTKSTFKPHKLPSEHHYNTYRWDIPAINEQKRCSKSHRLGIWWGIKSSCSGAWPTLPKPLDLPRLGLNVSHLVNPNSCSLLCQDFGLIWQISKKQGGDCYEVKKNIDFFGVTLLLFFSKNINYLVLFSGLYTLIIQLSCAVNIFVLAFIVFVLRGWFWNCFKTF